MKLNVRRLREKLGLAQPEFARLFDVHPMTVSRWERGGLAPSAYQQALMVEFEKAAAKTEVEEKLKSLLFAAGVVAAIYFLLNLAKK